MMNQHHISPSLDGIKDIKNTFKISTTNCAGLNSITKQEQILNFMHLNKIDIMGLSETKLKDSICKHIYKQEKMITTWWSNDDNNYYSTGVSIMIRNKIAKYVIKINRYNGRIIQIIMLMKGKIRLSIIQIYN